MASAALSPAPTAARRNAAKAKGRKAKVTCDDCFFQRNLLCALDASEPCPTFRHHEQGLTPSPQLSFSFRQPRTKAVWMFEEPVSR
ncbi:MAG: hypothetical protein JHC87_07105 [Thermoleophilaceae bacterium]|nr:hypothetical protein [Thermoleophilaceae bacterium]